MSFNASSTDGILHNSEGIHRLVDGERSPNDIIRMAQPATSKQARLVFDFSQLLHDHPEALPQVVVRLRSRLDKGDRAASMREAFEGVRWDMHLHMPNAVISLMARTLLYVQSDLNGFVKLNPIPLDDMLGMRVSERKLRGDYARRLEWWDGRPIAEPPALRKPMQSILPIQGGLFEVAQ